MRADKKMEDFTSFYQKIELDKQKLAKQVTENTANKKQNLASLFAASTKVEKDILNTALGITKNYFSKNTQASKNTFKTMMQQRLKKHRKKMESVQKEKPF